MSILDLYCAVDDFWQEFGPGYQARLVTKGRKQRNRQAEMAPSEIMTLLIRFHQSHYRTFKDFYTQYVQVHLRREFPCLVS